MEVDLTELEVPTQHLAQVRHVVFVFAGRNRRRRPVAVILGVVEDEPIGLGLGGLEPVCTLIHHARHL